MRKLLRGVVRLACFPVDVLAYTLCILLILLWQAGDLQRVQGGLLVLFFRPGSFAERHWNYATTLGHIVISNRSFMPALKMLDMVAHETVHIRQLEAVCVAWVGVAGILAALGVSPWWPLVALSPLAWLGFYLASIFCALSEGRRGYIENVLEEQAYEHVQSVRPTRPFPAVKD